MSNDTADVIRLRNRVAALERHNAELWECLKSSRSRADRYRLAWQSARERAKSAWRNAADWHEEATLLDVAVAHVRDVVYALPALPDPTNPEILFRVGQHDMAGRVKGVMGWPEKPGDRS